MLADIGVAATPGVDFDAERGSRYVRFCYAGTTADMAEAARRLSGWSRLKARAVRRAAAAASATCRLARVRVHSRARSSTRTSC